MTWLMEILKIKLEEQLLMKYCIIKHLILLKIQNMMDVNAELLHKWLIIFLIKKSSGRDATLANKCSFKNENILNKELAEELQKPFIRKCKKRQVYSTFIDKISGANLADIQLISKFGKGFRL